MKWTWFLAPLTHHEYAVDFKNLAVAIVISLLGPLATLGGFWGWWMHGRHFSLSPMEIANAFQPSSRPSGDGHGQPSRADVLRNCNSNAQADELLTQLRRVFGYQGEPLVQYGLMDADHRLAMGLVGPGGVKPARDGQVW